MRTQLWYVRVTSQGESSAVLKLTDRAGWDLDVSSAEVVAHPERLRGPKGRVDAYLAGARQLVAFESSKHGNQYV